jgi:hypothetical protein
MRVKNFLWAAALPAALSLFSSNAMSADSFTLYNDIKDPIVEFTTKVVGAPAWSRNWLASPIPMGGNRVLTFSANANQECKRDYTIKMASGKTYSAVHDFCKSRGIHVHTSGPAASAS